MIKKIGQSQVPSTDCCRLPLPSCSLLKLHYCNFWPFLTQMTKGHLCYCYGESLAMSESLFRVNDKKSETAVQTMLIFATDI